MSWLPRRGQYARALRFAAFFFFLGLINPDVYKGGVLGGLTLLAVLALATALVAFPLINRVWEWMLDRSRRQR